MQTVRLGKSELEVSKIGFGSIPIQRVSDDEAEKVIRRALEAGVNWIDSANMYGSSEERIGRAIRGYERESLIITTKGAGRTVKDLAEQVELSFQRLGVDYIDLYQFHCVSGENWETMQANGAVELILEMKRQERIGHVGASCHEEKAALAVLEHPEIEVMQWPFNFIVAEEGIKVREKCREKDVGFIAMKPFGGGALNDAAACIRFLMQFPAVAVDPGFASVEEVDEVIRLAEEAAKLSPRDKATIERLKNELGKRFCRRCGYCQPCPQEVKIVLLMNLNNIAQRFSRREVVEGKFAEVAASLEKCSDCGECESKCPYQLSIRQTLRENFQLFQKLKQPQN